MPDTVRLEQAAAKGPPGTLARSIAIPEPTDTSASEKGDLSGCGRFITGEGSAGNLELISPACRQKAVDSSRVTEKLQMLGRLEGR